MPALVFKPFGDRTAGRFGRSPFFGDDGDAVDQRLQAAQRFRPVLFKAAEFLRLDDGNAFLADALIAQLQQALQELGVSR